MENERKQDNFDADAFRAFERYVHLLVYFNPALLISIERRIASLHLAWQTYVSVMGKAGDMLVRNQNSIL